VEAHKQFSRSVIFGPYPYLPPPTENSEYRFLKLQVDEGLAQFSDKGKFAKADTVASGNLSIEKSQFVDGFYEEGLNDTGGRRICPYRFSSP
jgi:hypothetical protein